jgi:hypothetical protein
VNVDGNDFVLLGSHAHLPGGFEVSEMFRGCLVKFMGIQNPKWTVSSQYVSPEVPSSEHFVDFSKFWVRVEKKI